MSLSRVADLFMTCERSQLAFEVVGVAVCAVSEPTPAVIFVSLPLRRLKLTPFLPINVSLEREINQPNLPIFIQVHGLLALPVSGLQREISANVGAA